MAATTVIVLDNSEWMRNGDFVPTRIEQQFESFSRLCDAKMRHPESMVGLMTMSGKTPNVLVTPSTDIGKLLGSVHGKVRYEGEANVLAAMQIAQLALKHRQHKNHAPRIVLFVASPIREAEDKLVKLGKQLQKNEVAVDIINFGEEQENTPKLEAFLAAVNKNDNSHLVNVPAGVGILSDVLAQSPIIAGGGGDSGGGGNLNEFGVDPELDPELAMAMQMSMEEARRAEGESGGGDTGGADAAPAAPAASSFGIDAEDAELQAALAMSMEGVESTPAGGEDTTMSEPTSNTAAEAAAPASEPADMYSDPSFLSEVMSELEGVDPNDPEVKAMMEGLAEDGKKDEEKK